MARPFRWQLSSAASREMKGGFHSGLKPWVRLIVARQPYWPQTGFILAGFLADGRQLRISWFEEFRVDEY